MGWVVNATPRPLYPRERPGTHCIGGWVGPRAGLGGSVKSRPPTGIRSPDRPALSESLYRLRYPGPHQIDVMTRAVPMHKEEVAVKLHSFLTSALYGCVRYCKGVSNRNLFPCIIQGVPGGMDKTSGECSL